MRAIGDMHVFAERAPRYRPESPHPVSPQGVQYARRRTNCATPLSDPRCPPGYGRSSRRASSPVPLPPRRDRRVGPEDSAVVQPGVRTGKTVTVPTAAIPGQPGAPTPERPEPSRTAVCPFSHSEPTCEWLRTICGLDTRYAADGTVTCCVAQFPRALRGRARRFESCRGFGPVLRPAYPAGVMFGTADNPPPDRTDPASHGARVAGRRRPHLRDGAHGSPGAAFRATAGGICGCLRRRW